MERVGCRSESVKKNKKEKKKRTHIHTHSSWDKSQRRFTMGSVVPVEHLSIYAVVPEENNHISTAHEGLNGTIVLCSLIVR